jgi:glycosyltransferase involved in cell wall biosynthesis
MSLKVPASQKNGDARPRLLVVPHIYAENISVREIEFARRLTRRFDVYCLSWKDALHIEGANAMKRRWTQFRTALGAAFAAQRLRPASDGITYVVAPVLQPILVQRLIGSLRALEMSQSFNRRTLETLVDRLGITHLLVAAATFRLPRREGVHAYFDIVDWFPEDTLSPEVSGLKREEVKRAVQQAEGVFAVSDPLRERLLNTCEIESVAMPNGADLKVLRAVPPAEVAALRRSLGLEGKFIIGYVGNHGDYTGVNFVVEMFLRLRERIPDARLLIVGPGEHWRSLLESVQEKGVVWTGPISPAEVRTYFNALDVGVLAQGRTLGTDLAFQIKIVEYSACRKFVVSTPLRTWQMLAWPNVFLAERRVDDWVEAIMKARQSRWQPEWDARIAEYDWEALADRMADVMLQVPVTEALRCAS